MRVSAACTRRANTRATRGEFPAAEQTRADFEREWQRGPARQRLEESILVGRSAGRPCPRASITYVLCIASVQVSQAVKVVVTNTEKSDESKRHKRNTRLLVLPPR